MDRALPVIIIAILTVLALLGMYWGWRGRQKRQATLPHPQTAPAALGTEILRCDCLYVATTLAAQPLERIAVSGLGFPGQAGVLVTERGVALSIAGGSDAFIPSADLIGVGRATWTIDRAVESGGLVVVNWMLRGDNDVAVDTYLRIVEPENPTDFLQAIEGRIATNSGSEAQ
ncbi:hypothetical protein GCM10027052_28950 [Parafrigoribacterium mesophilum]|uniref:PH-like domain-containing protein n=1 Tax=Parafrigoribacterium mesophilum TaxID=433646 RepID=UPI0031FC9EBE